MLRMAFSPSLPLSPLATVPADKPRAIGGARTTTAPWANA